MDQMVGQILDNTYRIDALLGQGGMGAVFKARDIALNRDVAIKVMHPHVAVQEGFRERFLQEARAIAALEHPNIVPIHTFSRDPQLLYIVMSFVQGQNLRDWLSVLSQQGMVISMAEGLAMVELVADALAYAHRRGVFHRDIKPGNIILRPLEAGQTNAVGLSFQPIVTDFGLAKLSEGGIHSVTGMAMGTPAYMAPEQCEGLEIDGRADIYALGIVLYELVTGRVPFYVKTLTEAIRVHTKEPPPPPRSIAPDLPSQVEEIILKALAKRPQDRFQTADLMAQACRAARSALPRVDAATLATTQQGQVSLVTMMSREAPPPAPESDAWPTPPSEVPVGGRVLVMSPDGSTRAIALGGRQRLSIGRDANNDIAIPSARLSRHHAQLTFDGTRYFLTDLSSTNGTSIENDRLLPGIAEQWQPAKQARMGDHWLRLELAGAAAAAPARPDISAAPMAALAGRPTEQPVSVSMEPTQLTVRPGQAVEATLRILNRQQQVDHFAPSVEGIPDAWVTRPAQMLRLAPGDTGAMSLRFHPPLAPTSAAGAHPFGVRVMSQANPRAGVEVRGMLQIEAFHDIKAALSPTILSSPGRGTLRLANLGNAPEQVALTASDPAEALYIAPNPAQFALQAGQQAEIGLPVRTKTRRPLIGNMQTHAFVVNAVTPGGHGATVQGSLTVKPMIPAWAIPMLTMLALLLCAGAALAYSTAQRNNAAAATAQAATMVVQTGALQARLATATAEALHPAQTATAAAMSESQIQGATASAATATAEWLAADSDGDGLTNREELQWGTDPYNKDTDGDTLADGQEVAMGISPTSKDTDGDGLQDNVDPDPGKLPTPTAQPTETPEPSLTPTATATLTATPLPGFADNSTREFTFFASAVGTLNEVCLRHDNTGPSPDWYVALVEVDTGSGFKPYTFNRWIASDKADGSLTACSPVPGPTPTIGIVGPLLPIVPLIPLAPLVLPTATTGIYKIATLPGPVFRITAIFPLLPSYSVKVKTGGVAAAGTSARVQIRLKGSAGTTDWITLE
jgi:serine/threonine protein kinase